MVMIYGGDVFSVKLTPDELNAGAFCYGLDLMIYGGGVISRQVNTRRTERRSFQLRCLDLQNSHRESVVYLNR